MQTKKNLSKITALALTIAMAFAMFPTFSLTAHATSPGDLTIQGGGGGSSGDNEGAPDLGYGSGGGGGGYVLYTGTTPDTVFFGGGGIGGTGDMGGWRNGGNGSVSGGDSALNGGRSGNYAGGGNPQPPPTINISGNITSANISVTAMPGDNGANFIPFATPPAGGFGGNATVESSSGTVVLNTLTLISGEAGAAVANAAGGAGGNAVFNAAGKLDANAIVLNQNGMGFGYQRAAGAVDFTVGTLVSRLDNTFTIHGSPTVSISNFEFDLTGAVDGSTFLTANAPLNIAGKPLSLSGTPSGLVVGDKITLISDVIGSPSVSSLSTGGYTFSIAVDNNAALVATLSGTPCNISTIASVTNGSVSGTIVSLNSVSNATSSINLSGRITLTSTHATWELRVGGNVISNKVWTGLTVGSNSAVIRVIAQDGSHTDYAVTVTRNSGSGGGFGGTGGNGTGGETPTMPGYVNGDGTAVSNEQFSLQYPLPFEDVSASDWFYDSVKHAYYFGLMTGTSTQPMLFSPQMIVTRGMVVTVLYRMHGSPDVRGLTNPFSDVATYRYYTDAVIWAASIGIVLGYGDGRFGPNDNITRQDLAVILDRYAAFAEMDLPVTMEYNVFDPRGNATRAELAVMLHNFFETVKPSEEANADEE